MNFAPSSPKRSKFSGMLHGRPGPFWRQCKPIVQTREPKLWLFVEISSWPMGISGASI
uniref:Uncharacterized protein n=1 Tax=Romanomermis culicivorax TaxID=13658 RepID=A0A915LCG2_ROMCU